MEYYQGDLAVHIHWVLAKPAMPGWEDIRRTVTGHTFYYIYSGKGVFRREGGDDVVEGGTLVYLRPGMPLYMKSSALHPLRMTMLLFDCASLRKGGDGWGPPEPVERLQLPFLMPLQKDRMGRIGMLFQEAESEWVPGDPGREARVKSVWYRLIQELHEAAEAEWSEGLEEGLAAALRRLKENLDRGFASELRIAELVEQSGFSPAYMRRTFAARYGCGPKEYLDRLRNEHAVRRLLYTGDSVTDIARACGYLDVYQFSKAFKKRNGLAPTDYRRERERLMP
jgi:AraC family transcriptional regulator